VRYARVFQNKKGEDKFAFKLNGFFLRVNDWEAENLFESYRDTANTLNVRYVGEDNPGRFDAVNRYGDEYFGNATGTTDQILAPGLGRYYRSGYLEPDLVDYNTRNVKASAALHYKITPKVELIGSSGFGSGTTVYQGDNRYSLKNILFFQQRLEVRQQDKFFLRAYATHEDGGDSYDAVFTAFKMQDAANGNIDWSTDYRNFWRMNINPKVKALPGFPTPGGPPNFFYDFAAADSVMAANSDSLNAWHAQTLAFADRDLAKPGTAAYDSLFNDIISRPVSEGGTRFVDHSALYHVHGEYRFNPSFMDITIGGNGRFYTPNSEGTIFSDTLSIRKDTLTDGTVVLDTVRKKITNFEVGFYAGAEKKFISGRLKLNATVRVDKNQNFNWLVSPAVSAVYIPKENHILRTSFSAAIRNPTLADQFLYYNVGRALLVGNLEGFNNLITAESFNDYRNTPNLDTSLLVRFDIAPVQPEKVKTVEIGYRGIFFNHLYVDASYYFSFYDAFIGYNLGVDAAFVGNFPASIQVYRVAANATDRVTTQGFSIGLNYFFDKGYAINGNYSWNVLNTNSDDPIIPAFNTPPHKFNIGISGRELTWGRLRNIGFSTNYKWVQSFVFEGSPQFTGIVPSYGMLDAQFSKYVPKIKTNFKLGCQNLLNNKAFTVYGGPRIGRIVYFTTTVELDKL
jgi:hypothetical protein